MNTFKGPFRIIFEELRIQFYIMAIITIAITALYVFIGVYNSEGETFNVGVNFGPIYGFLLFYPLFFFNGAYKFTLALGGTRKQFMHAVSIAGLLFIVFGMLLINILAIANSWLVDQNYSSGVMFQIGDLLSSSNMLLYYWIDLLYGIFLFGFGLLISSIWFFFGTVRTLAMATLIGMILILLITFGDVSILFEAFLAEQLRFAHLLGGVGFISAILSFLIMKNGPLERGGDRGFLGRKSQA